MAEIVPSAPAPKSQKVFPVVVASANDVTVANATTKPIVLAPTSRPTGSTGQYMTLGGVVMEVNGTPIYTNRIIGAISRALAANAAELDSLQYQKVASELIIRQIHEARDEELLFATAQRNLDEKDKQIAEMLTSRWRQQKITEFGGSLELARRNSATIARRNDPQYPEDMSFDEQVKQQYRSWMTKLFLERKVNPRIAVSADDMRDYYRKNLEKEFTEHSQVRFRLIKIDPKVRGGREEALTVITGLRNRVTTGNEDFAAVAKLFNDDRQLAQAEGDMGWIGRGNFVLEKVEQAAWDLQPGETTDIIEDGKAFYIAKVEEKKAGRVRAFEEREVQQQIQNTIRREQFSILLEMAKQKLKENAVVRYDENMMATVIEMAMQMYPRWAKAQPVVSRGS